ncbi:MAG: D-tyrosyl-tRNA(Tyr) deacylase [Clostridiales bacterium]|nr:D-tyrosyl-tRNA(Tyr) deacylase [Clostridiales bacterium]
MRAVLQRVKYSHLSVENQSAAEIKGGIVALIGIKSGDNEEVFAKIIDKITNLRIFEDDKGKMNLSVKDINGGILAVPNFTLYSDCRHGRRPDFAKGAPPAEAKAAFEAFADRLKASYPDTQTGVFGADMQIELLNDGPITIILDSDELITRRN